MFRNNISYIMSNINSINRYKHVMLIPDTEPCKIINLVKSY